MQAQGGAAHRAGARDPQGTSALGTGRQLALLPEPFTQGDSSQLRSPRQAPSDRLFLSNIIQVLSLTAELHRTQGTGCEDGDITTLKGV